MKIPASISDIPLLTPVFRVEDTDTSATSASLSTDLLANNVASMLSTPLPSSAGSKASGPDTILLIAIGTLVGGIALCILCVISGSIWFHLKEIREQKHVREILKERQMVKATQTRVSIMDYDHHPDYLLTRKLNLSALSRSVSFPSLGNATNPLFATPRRSISLMRYPRPSSRVQPLPTLLEGDSPHSLHLTSQTLSCDDHRSFPEVPISDHASGTFCTFSSKPAKPQQQPLRRLDSSLCHRNSESTLLTSDSEACTTATLVESGPSLPGFFKIEFSEPLCSEITALRTLSDCKNAEISVKKMGFSPEVWSESSGDMLNDEM